MVFNQDISSWNVSSVTDMRSMFKRASLFSYDMMAWSLQLHANMIDNNVKFSHSTVLQDGIFADANSFQANVRCPSKESGPLEWCECTNDCSSVIPQYSTSLGSVLNDDNFAAISECLRSGSGDYITHGNCSSASFGPMPS